MNNDELKKKIVDIALHAEWTDMFGDHNSIGKYAANAIADALIAAGIGDVKEVEKEYRNTMLLAVKCQTLASERSRYMELNKNIAEYRAARAERAGKIAASKVFDYTYEEAVAQAEKELAEENDGKKEV